MADPLSPAAGAAGRAARPGCGVGRDPARHGDLAERTVPRRSWADAVAGVALRSDPALAPVLAQSRRFRRGSDPSLDVARGLDDRRPPLAGAQAHPGRAADQLWLRRHRDAARSGPDSRNAVTDRAADPHRRRGMAGVSGGGSGLRRDSRSAFPWAICPLPGRRPSKGC